MLRVGIVGATGYTALELIRILLRHPSCEITTVTSRDESHPFIHEVHASLRDRLNLRFEQFEIDSFRQNVDFAFCCLPHAASAVVVKQLRKAKIPCVDFSADYRLNDAETFSSLYQVEHPDAESVGNVPYGIPELFESEIAGAQLVANPGCFPTSMLIPMAPLFGAGLVQPDSIIVDSKTGISGAGRKASLAFHFPESNESVKAYSIGKHRHAPEMNHIIKRFCKVDIQTVFTPHLIPMDRGILSTIYIRSAEGHSSSDLLDCLADYYRDHVFVRITNESPGTKDVCGTNFCDIHVKRSGDSIVIVSAIDNLIKGASGAAVQNFNLMNGFKQETALI